MCYDKEFHFNNNIKDLIEYYTSGGFRYEKINDEFYAIQERSFKYDESSKTWHFTHNDSRIILMIDPDTNMVIGSGIIYPKSKHLSRNIVIDSDYRNKGYGTKFIKCIIDKFGINNLSVRTHDDLCIKLFEKWGFEICYKYQPKNYTSDMVSFYHMQLRER